MIANKKKFFIISAILSILIISSTAFAFIYALNISNNIVVPQNRALLITSKGNIELELAKTPQEQMIGLMNRTSLDLNKGMIFIFSNEEPRSFWMKDTLISLDIIFLDRNFNVVKIHKNTKPNQTEQIYYSELPSKYVIELNSGASDTYQIKEADQLSIQF